MPAQTPNHRTVRACTHCNGKKIRCRITNTSNAGGCDTCHELAIECVPRSRKKRRTVPPARQHQIPSQSPVTERALDLHANVEQILPYQYWESGPGQWDSTDTQLTVQPQHPSQIGLTPWSTNQDVPTEVAHQSISGAGIVEQQAHVAPNTQVTLEDNDFDSLRNQHEQSFRDSNNQKLTRASAYVGVSQYAAQDITATYVGRSQYISEDMPASLTFKSHVRDASKDEPPSDSDLKILEIHDAFLLPPRAVRQSLIATYVSRCLPWTPILTSTELNLMTTVSTQISSATPPSLLLQQALFLAASRVSTSPGVESFASPSQFYSRAKALFWCGYESDPLTVIKSTIAMQWWNPDGPERFSCDSSRFWLGVSVGLAHQCGLHREPPLGEVGRGRRKVWWTIVARDCLVASGQGRPRAINVKDSDVRPLCLDDFPESKAHGELFVAFVEICCLLGDLTECRARKHMSRSKQLYLESGLYRWSKALPASLHLSHISTGSEFSPFSTCNFNACQLHLPYLTALTIMARSQKHIAGLRHESNTTTRRSSISWVAILASSFVAGIFEDFLARDEIRYLSSIFTFYILAAGIALVSTHGCRELWILAREDVAVLQNSLRELAKRWQSAVGALKALQNVLNKALLAADQANNRINTGDVSRLGFMRAEQETLFNDMPRELCRLWMLYEKQRSPLRRNDASIPDEERTDRMTAEILEHLRYLPSAPPGEMHPEAQAPAETPGEYADISLDNFGYDGIGSWLLTNLGADSP